MPLFSDTLAQRRYRKVPVEVAPIGWVFGNREVGRNRKAGRPATCGNKLGEIARGKTTSRSVGNRRMHQNPLPGS
jgi:hypothetical protein